MKSAKGKFWVAVVDDQSMVRKAIERLLKAAGYTVEGFASAEEFLRCDHYESAGCLLLDIGLPGMSGLELQQQLKKDGSVIPVVFMTGQPDDTGDRVARAMRDGALAFIAKPFRHSEVLDAIEAARVAWGSGKVADE